MKLPLNLPKLPKFNATTSTRATTGRSSNSNRPTPPGNSRPSSSRSEQALPPWRSKLVFALIAGGFGALIGRTLYLQAFHEDFLQQMGDARYSRIMEISANRGVIVDRNGKPLAISTPVESIWISPSDAKADAKQLQELARLLELPLNEVTAKFADTNKDFLYLKRQIPPELAQQVVDLGIQGVFKKREYRRYYPAGEMLAHIIGSTNIDQIGQEGLELTRESWLKGKPGSRRVIKDRRGHIVEDVAHIRPPQEGRQLKLSIDTNLQNIAYGQLRQAVVQHKAKAGSLVILDAKSGEILAMANLPSYNPNNRIKLDPSVKRNRAVIDTFEPGSTMKPFSVSAGLASGKFHPNSVLQTGHILSIGPANIRDAHGSDALSVAQIIQKSSNIGTSKIALSLPPEYMWNMYDQAGFGHAPQSGFPGESAGRMRPFKTWKPIEQATMSYGHGIAVTLLQMARAYTLFTTDGQLLPVSLLKQDTLPVGKQVIAPEIAREMRKMLETVTQPGGTAPKAQVLGYRVAGKTGTAHKPDGHGYAADRYISSFVGFAPVSDPRLIIAVMIDEPSNGQYYGGAVAAPVFSQVAAGALRMLAVPPDAPANQQLRLPTAAEEVKESL